MLRCFILPTLIFLSSFLSAQDFWVNARLTGLFDESHEMIKTSDDGFISVGTFNSIQTRVTKFSNSGVIEWQSDIPSDPSSFVTVSLAVVEGDGKYFIAESSLGSDYLSSIISLDLNGVVINKNTTKGFDINELMINSNGDLFVLYNEALTNETTISALNQSLEILWEQPLSNGVFPLFDANAYIDDLDHIHLWLSDINNANQAFYYLIDSDGTIEEKTFPLKISENIESVLHGQLENGNIAYVQKGGSINGSNAIVALVNPTTTEQLSEFELGSYFFWISDLTIIDDDIFITGNWAENGGIWPAILVLDNTLKFKEYFSLKEPIQTAIPNLNGADIFEVKTDDQQNIIAAGILLNPHPTLGTLTASGPLNMYIHKNGTLNDPLSTFQNELASTLSIYPNPSSDYINIKSEASNDIKTIKIYKLDGALVHETKNLKQGAVIDIKNLQSGMYQIITETQKTLYSTQFIKK